MADFNSVLNKKVEDVEKPKPRPVGSYLATVVGMPKQKTPTVQGEERSILSFSIKLMAAKEDVDFDRLQEHADISTWPQFNHDIWIDTPEGEYALRKFLTDTLQIDPGPDGATKTLGEMAAESPGRQLIVTLKHDPYINKTSGEAEIATRIQSTAAA